MRIALVSYEYPPDTAVGGIATYMQQWAKVLSSHKVDVEVFCASTSRNISEEDNGIMIHRTKEDNRINFKKTILNIFEKRHKLIPFDYIECPEIFADALLVKKKFPEIKIIVKLHTPSFLIDKINNTNITNWQKIRTIIGAYRRLTKPQKFWYNKELNYKQEKELTINADVITSPSLSLKNIVCKKWSIPNKKINVLPNPFIPNESFLSIEPNIYSKTILFIGRLEKRKGILLFLRLIPKLLKKHPQAKFKFIGADTSISSKIPSTKLFIETKLKKYKNNLEFHGSVPPNEISTHLADNLLCIFPSIWENFPTVCLEAMSAGKTVIGSKNGGMYEMLREPKCGVLINPFKTNKIVNVISYFLEHPKKAIQLGQVGRQKVLNDYNSNKIYNDFVTILLKR